MIRFAAFLGVVVTLSLINHFTDWGMSFACMVIGALWPKGRD